MRVEGLGFRVEGLGFRIEGLGFRVEGLGGLGATSNSCFPTMKQYKHGASTQMHLPNLEFFTTLLLTGS